MQTCDLYRAYASVIYRAYPHEGYRRWLVWQGLGWTACSHWSAHHRR